MLKRFYSNFYGCGCRLVWERVWTQHVSLGLVQEGGELEQLGAELAGNLPPLRCCSVGIILGERCGNAGGDDAPPALACTRQRVAHEVDAAPLPAGVEYLADGGLDALCQQIDLSQRDVRDMITNVYDLSEAIDKQRLSKATCPSRDVVVAQLTCHELPLFN